jgi:hypothetical protein
LLQVYIPPTERQELPLSHARLEGHEAQRSIWLLAEMSEESRELVVLEVGSFLSLGAGSLSGRELSNGIRVREAIEDGCLQARA